MKCLSHNYDSMGLDKVFAKKPPANHTQSCISSSCLPGDVSKEVGSREEVTQSRKSRPCVQKGQMALGQGHS